MPLDLAIHGGAIVTATETRRADIGVSDGKIVAIGDVGDAVETHDASGLLVLPGVVDPHTHLEAQFRQGGPTTADDFLSGTEAAACGGVTTIIDYARQFPGSTLAEGIREWDARAAPKSLIDYSFHIVVTDFSDATLAEVPALLADGFPTVKAFMMRVADRDLLKLMRASADAGGLVMAHAENPAVLDYQQGKLFAEGKRSAVWYRDSRPEIGEAEATARAIDYADLTGATVCVVHLSCDAALQRAREAKARGSRPWIEVRPCYLLLDADCYTAPGVDPLTMSGCPPLRPAVNLPKLWEGLADGTIDMVGSDHCAWAIEEKRAGEHDFSLIPHGIPALETQLPALWDAGVRGAKGRMLTAADFQADELASPWSRITPNRLVDAMSTTPARLHGLYPRKGTIALGSDADLVLFDPTRAETISQSRLHSRAGYEPCEGMDVVGWPVATFSRGELIAKDGQVVGRPGRGKLLRRQPPPR
ncbi:MAG: dihydropyrimidinase [Chloroflexi bacterium]|nr:dihydropyrimidinase [Chloroflexota bacterium]